MNKDDDMPIYEYQCQKCHHHLEALQKVSDKPLRECPECGKHTLQRLMSAPMFRLSGSGWYETDFKGEKDKKRNLVDGSGGSDSSSSAAEAAKLRFLRNGEEVAIEIAGNSQQQGRDEGGTCLDPKERRRRQARREARRQVKARREEVRGEKSRPQALNRAGRWPAPE